MSIFKLLSLALAFRVYPTGDAVDVYRAVFNVLYRQHGESPSRVVLWYRTVRRPRGCAEYPCPSWPKHTSNIDSTTISAFERISMDSAPIDPGFSPGLPVELFRDEDQVQLTDIGGPIRDSVAKVDRNAELIPFWFGFRVRYPGAWGYVTLSQVGFNTQHTEAIVQVVHRCGNSCGSIEEMFFRKQSGKWIVAERIIDGMDEDRVDILRRYISADGYSMDSVVLGSLRYVGPNAHRLAEFRSERDSVARAKSDSIALDAAPRRIRGTIINMKAGQPISFAQIFVRSAQPYPKGTLTRIVADKLGRYEIRDPPIGGTLLEAQCPGRAHVDGRTLDAPSLYVRPAIDTIMNLKAPDVAPCWTTRNLRELSSGWVESVEATTATTPSPDEARIYEAVINDFRSTLVRGRIAAMFSHTVNRCDDSERCGSVQLARLEREGVVDSTTISDFNSKTKTAVPLNPRFAAAMRLHVVASDEIQFLAKESEPFSEPTRYARDDSARFWTAFKKIHGDMQGILSLTRIGFDASKLRALVEARVDFGMSRWDNPLRMFLLRKVNDVWRIELRDVGDGATSGEWIGDRCVPVKPPPNLSRSLVATLQGDFDVLLVPTVGRIGSNRVRLRLSSPWNDKVGTPPKNSFNPNDPSLEVIDEKTGKPDEKRVLDFSLVGPGVTFRQATNWVRTDGYTQAMQIRQVDSTGFFGSWSAGVFVTSQFGHFCARRLPPQ